MKILAAVLVLLLLAILLPKAFHSSTPEGAYRELPWQVDVLADGHSRVFGVTLEVSTLDALKQRHGNDMQLAVVAKGDEPGALEAYYETFEAGPISGRLIVTLAATATQLQGYKQRTAKADYMATGAARKYSLSHEDVQQAGSLPIAALSFIPAANLDAAVVLDRFGASPERVRTTAHTEHFLYPARGIDVIVDSEGKELIQYVSPSRFDQLRKPLVAEPQAGQAASH